jgi:hypothetical protein
VLLVGAYLFGGWSHYKAAEKAHLADRFLTVAASMRRPASVNREPPQLLGVSGGLPPGGV